MGQIITSLINFFLEIGRSGEQYKTRRSRNQAGIIIVIVLALIFGYGTFKGFGSAYLSKVEVVRIKRQLEKSEQLSSRLFRENEVLRIRNEILSSTLSLYIGKSLVERLNSQGKEISPDNLPSIFPDTIETEEVDAP